MVAIEHRQKSAIIATDTTTTTITTPTPTQTAISLSPSEELTNIETLATTTSSRRSSDIVNSNDIAVLSPTPSTNSSSTITVITTTNTATSNIIFVAPNDSEDTKKLEDEEIEVEGEEVQCSTSQKLVNSPAKMSQSSSEASTATAESAAVANKQAQIKQHQQQQQMEPAVSKSAVSQRNVDIKIGKNSNKDIATQELTKKVLKLDLTGKDLEEYSIKSPKSPIATRLQHQSSLTTVDVEDRKTLREALYQGIFHRHRRTIFAVGSFLRMLRSRNSSYNTIRSSSEGEDVDETR